MNSLRFKYTPLEELGDVTLNWLATYYHPSLGPPTDRLKRLEDECKLVWSIQSMINVNIWKKGDTENECFQSKAFRDRFKEEARILVEIHKEKTGNVKLRIKKLILKKRFLLHMIFFILENEPDLASRFPIKDMLKKHQDMVEEETTHFMGLLDGYETAKNPNYLK
jgi:hypothetical protein